MTRNGTSGLQISLMCETRSSGATRREKSRLTAPVRIAVQTTVVGDLLPTSPAGVDGVELLVVSVESCKGYPLAVR